MEPRWVNGRLTVAAVLVLAACHSEPTGTVPLATDAETALFLSMRSITIPHHYRLYPTRSAYLAAFDSLQRIRWAQRGTGGLSLDCMPMERVRGGGSDSRVATRLMVPDAPSLNVTALNSMARVQVFGPGSEGYEWIQNLAYSMPARFTEWYGWGCGGSAPLYGAVTSDREYRVEDTGDIEPDYQDPPVNAPQGVDQDAYNLLNRSEKILLLVYLAFANSLINAVNESMNWALAEAPGICWNNLCDALRHAYWQCRFSQIIGQSGAALWGNAHEQFGTDPAEVRMDLHNNRIGREIAGHFTSCEDGVRYARDQGWLQPQLMPEPTSTPGTVLNWPPAPPVG